MDLSTLTSGDLRRISELLDSKQKLLSDIAAIDAELSNFGGAPAAPKSKGPVKIAKAAKGGRGPRGELKEAILDLLKAAGKSGTTVKAIAAATKRNPANIYTWFFTTGKKIKQIKKVGGATYAWVG